MAFHTQGPYGIPLGVAGAAASPVSPTDFFVPIKPTATALNPNSVGAGSPSSNSKGSEQQQAAQQKTAPPAAAPISAARPVSINIEVKLINGKLVKIDNISTHATLAQVMERMLEKEGVRDGKLLYQGKELQMQARLIDYGIRAYAGTVLHHVLKVRGGGSPAVNIQTFKFADLNPLADTKAVPNKNFDATAPSYRHCKPGLFAMVVCRSSSCKAKDEWVLHNFGHGTHNIAMCMHEVECPSCHTAVTPGAQGVVMRWAVNQCRWKFKGWTDKHEKVESKDWIVSDKNGYYMFEDEKQNQKLDYSALNITTEPLPKK